MSRSRTKPWKSRLGLLTAGALLASAALFSPATEQVAASPPKLTAVFDDSDRFETYSSERPVAPGVTLTSFDAYGPDTVTGDAGWMQGSLLTADLTGDVRLDRIFPGEVAKREELTTQANRAGAVAAINASYFDISTTGAPWGVGISDGEMVQSPHIDDPLGACPECSVTVTEDGVAAVGEILFEGTVNLPGGATAKLDAINKPRFQIEDGIMAFTPVWGSATRNRPVDDTDQKIEVVITDGKVSSTSPVPGDGELPDNAFTLVARGSAVQTLAALSIGDPVSIEYDFRTPDDQRIRAAASGRQILVAEGEPQQPRVNSSDPQPHPRTAVGFSRDGKTMYMLTVDGRQPEFSAGVSLDELATMMVDLGAWSAVNFDGGGSTTLVAREPGQDEVELINRPSEFDDDEVRPGEFTQRPVPDGLALFVPEGSGTVQGLWLETAVDPMRASGPNFVPQLRTDRVFPGLTRTITAAPHDEMYSPAELGDRDRVQWRSSDRRVGNVTADDGSGVFTARSPGSTTVTAAVGKADGDIDLTVLSALQQIRPSVSTIDLAAGDDAPSFDVIGADAEGYTAPIEPADVQLDYDESVLSVEVGEGGRFTVAGQPFDGTREITITVGGISSTLPVTYQDEVELEEVVVDDFQTTENWDLWVMRAEGSWTTTPDGLDGTAGRLDYDFTQSTETRGVGIWPADGFFELTGKPTELRLQVKSAPAGMRARVEIMDSLGVLRTVEPGFVEGTDWTQISYPVPEDVVYPIKLRRIYFNEIQPSQSYQGTTLVDQLTAIRPVEPEPEQQRPTVDPIVTNRAPGGPGGWQFAVVSDLGVSADEPDGPAVTEARRVLSEVRERDPELVIVDSGFVASGSPENFALAKEILDAELTGIDYRYVPGAAELTDGSLETFAEVFGEPQQVVDHHGTRFLLQDTARGDYRQSDWRQLQQIHDQLDRASDDRRVDSVVLVQSRPLRDGIPPTDDQLSDKKEAATIEQWLTDFGEESGKDALVIAATEPTFAVSRVDGVPQVINGAGSTANASGLPYGGFAGWSLVDVTGKKGPDGFSVEFVPQVDTLSVTGPDSLAVGSTADVSATVEQAGEAIAVDYPMGVTWRGSKGVHIGPAAKPGKPGKKDMATFDPRTGKLTALRGGTITLSLTVGDQTEKITVKLTR